MKPTIQNVVTHGVYDQDANEFQLPIGDHVVSIPANLLRRAIMRLRQGFSYITALPDRYMERSDAAFLLANSSTILAIIRDGINQAKRNVA